MDSIDKHIIEKIKKAKGGTVFFTEDFLRFGSSKAVGKALERLVERAEISRVARGMYARLKTHEPDVKKVERLKEEKGRFERRLAT